MTYFDLYFDEIDPVEHEYWDNYHDEEGDYDIEDNPAFQGFMDDYWYYMNQLVETNSHRLDDTPIFNTLAVERRDLNLLPRCPHGMSAELCEGPMHYPDDRWDD